VVLNFETALQIKRNGVCNTFYSNIAKKYTDFEHVTQWSP